MGVVTVDCYQFKPASYHLQNAEVTISGLNAESDEISKDIPLPFSK